MSDTCSLFPPFGDPWLSCLLPTHYQEVTHCKPASMAQWGTVTGQEVRVRSRAEGGGEREGPVQGDLL